MTLQSRLPNLLAQIGSVHHRSEWTTAGPAKRLIAVNHTHVEVHHLGDGHPARTNPAAALEGARRFHVDVKGWSDLFYNLAIDPFTGELWEGRGAGWRSTPNPSGALSLLLLGDFHTGSDFGDFPKALATIGRVATIVGGVDALDWHKARQARTGAGSASACPGQTTIPVLQRLKAGGPTVRVFTPVQETAPGDPDVLAIQRLLNSRGITDSDNRAVTEDGQLGPRTWQAMGKAQFVTGLIPDPAPRDWGPRSSDALTAYTAPLPPVDPPPVDPPPESTGAEIVALIKHTNALVNGIAARMARIEGAIVELEKKTAPDTIAAAVWQPIADASRATTNVPDAS